MVQFSTISRRENYRTKNNSHIAKSAVTVNFLSNGGFPLSEMVGKFHKLAVNLAEHTFVVEIC